MSKYSESRKIKFYCIKYLLPSLGICPRILQLMKVGNVMFSMISSIPDGATLWSAANIPFAFTHHGKAMLTHDPDTLSLFQVGETSCIKSEVVSWNVEQNHKLSFIHCGNVITNFVEKKTSSKKFRC